MSMSEYLDYDEMTEAQRRSIIEDAVISRERGVIEWASVDDVERPKRPKVERYELRVPLEGEQYRFGANTVLYTAHACMIGKYFVLIPYEK